eukprot:TRINITY_DN18125_c0_g2_i2.p1 TRINITY_DN18125_c0_g2~~TRINITY_DN18125_c0_g2_i2.p1  ORF type:complete len:229 (-),score=80.07 TRINITY_DN18125_c0_g2_i2:73-696(-)
MVSKNYDNEYNKIGQDGEIDGTDAIDHGGDKIKGGAAKMEFDEKDLNDPTLLDELDDIDSEGENEIKERLAKIEQDIKRAVAAAIKARNEGNIENAKKFLMAKKKLEKEKEDILEKHPKLKKVEAQNPPAAPAEPQPKPPEKKKLEEQKAPQPKMQIINLGDLSKLEIEDIAVSYTHLTLPTILLVQISVVAVSLKKKKNNRQRRKT